ncbi:MAG: hypothetical protein ABSG90_04675 [Dehalococcoidia bacterium]|jgi:hypothetical protein
MELEDKSYLLDELQKPDNQKPLAPELIQKLDIHFLRFCNLLEKAKGTKEDVLIINNASAYRYMLASITNVHLLCIDFTKISNEALLYCQHVGVHNYLLLKRKSQWDGFKFPTEPVPLDFLTEQIFISSEPLESYYFLIFSCYLWQSARNAIIERLNRNSPELFPLLDYAAATNPKIDELTRELFSQEIAAADKNQAWNKIIASPKISIGLTRLSHAFRDIFDLTSEHCDIEMSESRVEAEEKLLGNVQETMINHPADAILKGMQGYFSYSLLNMTKHDLIDETIKTKKHRKRDVTESQIEEQLIQKAVENYTPSLDPLEGKDLNEGQSGLGGTTDFKSLDLDTGKLTPTELRVLSDVLQGFKDGYEFDSKRGLSFRQRWGKDYDKNIKAYNRAKTKLRRT